MNVNDLWSDDLPTMEGFYLHRQLRQRLFLLLVEDRGDGVLIIERDGDEEPLAAWQGEWIGPIEGAFAM